MGERVTRDVARRDATYAQAGSLPSDQSVLSRPCRMTSFDTRTSGRNAAQLSRASASRRHARASCSANPCNHAAHEMEHHAPPRMPRHQAGQPRTLQTLVRTIFRYATVDLERISTPRRRLPANSPPSVYLSGRSGSSGPSGPSGPSDPSGPG